MAATTNRIQARKRFQCGTGHLLGGSYHAVIAGEKRNRRTRPPRSGSEAPVPNAWLNFGAHSADIATRMPATGRKSRKLRDGRLIASRNGARWTVQVEIDDFSGDRFLRLRLDVQGRFPSEDAAVRAAQPVLTEWCLGGVTLRDLLLRELAATYRYLRERHPLMDPAAVPTTSGAWYGALTMWERAGRLDAAAVARYRDHVAHAFDVNATAVKRHGLLEVEAEADTVS
jgi:hypothetical protein